MLLPRYYFLLLGTERAGVTKGINKHLLRRYTRPGSKSFHVTALRPSGDGVTCSVLLQPGLTPLASIRFGLAMSSREQTGQSEEQR